MVENGIGWRRAVPASMIASVLMVSGCAGAGGGGGEVGADGESRSINVLMVGNPQMEDIQKLTADSFTKWFPFGARRGTTLPASSSSGGPPMDWPHTPPSLWATDTH